MRGSDKLFSVGYTGGFGEQGVDAGGPYRECLTEVCTNLFDIEILDLFIKSPNTKDERGQTRDRFVPNPEYTSPKSIQMYEFVGVWMGISFRTKSTLPFQLSSMLWKTLVGERYAFLTFFCFFLHQSRPFIYYIFDRDIYILSTKSKSYIYI